MLIKELRKLKVLNSLTVTLLRLDNKRMLTKSWGDTPQEPDLRDTFTHD